MQKILFLSPHTDDVELACGGTLARFVGEGKECFVVAFSSADSKELLVECKWSLIKGIGILPRNVFLLPIEPDPIRHFPEHRQEILDILLHYRKEIQPDTIFCPSSFDSHQDHEVIRQEAFRAFKQCTILGYEMPWNNREFRTDCFIGLDNGHIEKKLAAIACYESQNEKPYCNPELIRGFAACRGAMVGKAYAEAFEVIRQVL